MYSLSDALGKAKAGDTIFLADGTYTDRVESITAGRNGSPIKIKGGNDAVVKAESPSVLIQHSWITIQVGRAGSSRCAHDNTASVIMYNRTQVPVRVHIQI